MGGMRSSCFASKSTSSFSFITSFWKLAEIQTEMYLLTARECLALGHASCLLCCHWLPYIAFPPGFCFQVSKWGAQRTPEACARPPRTDFGWFTCVVDKVLKWWVLIGGRGLGISASKYLAEKVALISIETLVKADSKTELLLLFFWPRGQCSCKQLFFYLSTCPWKTLWKGSMRWNGTCAVIRLSHSLEPLFTFVGYSHLSLFTDTLNSERGKLKFTS